MLVLLLLIAAVCLYCYDSASSIRVVAIVIKSSTLIYKVIEVNDRRPVYRLATLDGRKPEVNGDQAQATVVEHLKLAEQCQRDPSLIVVDVGAYVGKTITDERSNRNVRTSLLFLGIGDFGLYAAACDCQVYLFEVQPAMVDLIQSSIIWNNFSSSRVRVINKAISDLPTNSQLTFSIAGGDTTVKNGSLHVSTIRLDDVPWPEASKILLLKIDVEGFELNVLRSAERLFRQRRIQHLIFEYTAWWTDRSSQKDLLPFVQHHLQTQTFYALDRLGRDVYGPLDRETLERFYESHHRRHLQTDIYAPLINLTASSMIKAKRYDPQSAMA